MRSRDHITQSGDVSESTIQRMVIQWADLFPELKGRLIHIPNEGKRTKVGGYLAKKGGLRPGVADLFLPIANGGYHGLWIELKSKKGVVSEAQRNFLSDMESLGYLTVICRSFEQCIDVISRYMQENRTLTYKNEQTIKS